MVFDERAFRLVWRDRPARQLYNAIAILERDIVRARNMHLPELRDLERQKEIVATILEQRLRPPRNMGGSISVREKSKRVAYTHAKHVISGNFPEYIKFYLQAAKQKPGTSIYKFLRKKFLGGWYYYARTKRWRKVPTN